MFSCIFYLAFTGILSFLLGRILPKNWFCPDRFPYQCFEWENGGHIYERIHIKSWQNKVPDMSKIFPNLMPRKQIDSVNMQILPRMVQETCVAEFIHLLLCVSGLWCIRLWSGIGGIFIAFLNTVGNLAFVVIQRYNRPRLLHLMGIVSRRHRVKEVSYASSGSKL